MNKDLRDFVFRGLLFESASEEFRGAGIRVGSDLAQSEDALLSESLAPFSVQIRNNALRMARLYAAIHCFENSVRDLIRETLLEKEGPEWWDKVPQKVRQKAEQRRKEAMENSWLEGDISDNLGFVDFGDLAKIIIENWEHFAAIIPTQHWLVQRLDEMEKSRNFIAHNRILLPTEFQRLYMYIADWNRQVGM